MAIAIEFLGLVSRSDAYPMDVPMTVYLGSEEQALELLREYAEEVRRVTPAGTEVVVLPEKIGRVSESALTEVDPLFSSAATRAAKMTKYAHDRIPTNSTG